MRHLLLNAGFGSFHFSCRSSGLMNRFYVRQKLLRAREIVKGVGKMKEDRACPLNSR